MQINITIETEKYLKKIWNTSDITSSIQSVVDNYITQIVEKNYTDKIKKTIDQKIKELNN